MPNATPQGAGGLTVSPALLSVGVARTPAYSLWERVFRPQLQGPGVGSETWEVPLVALRARPHAETTTLAT